MPQTTSSIQVQCDCKYKYSNHSKKGQAGFFEKKRVYIGQYKYEKYDINVCKFVSLYCYKVLSWNIVYPVCNICKTAIGSS